MHGDFTSRQARLRDTGEVHRSIGVTDADFPISTNSFQLKQHTWGPRKGPVDRSGYQDRLHSRLPAADMGRGGLGVWQRDWILAGP
jgi:hypothetical protein